MSHTLPLQSSSRYNVENFFRSHKLASLTNQLRRALGVGNYWSWIEVPELSHGIEIAAIVCPLRYDVFVRRDFYSFYTAHRALYQSDRTAFMACAKQTSYFTWYLESEAVRTNKHLRGNIPALALNFIERIDRAVALYESVARHGFSPRYPITLKTAKHILPPTTDRSGPPTSKRIRTKYFLADGCHRLALLMALGYRTLPPNFFRVKQYQAFSPFDSTILLARRLIKDPATYFSFLSTYYASPILLTNQDDLLNYIETHKPEWMDEVVSVIHADGFDA